MLDYKGLEALYAVIQTQSFDLAAKQLYITQSAISQRIKALESFHGKPLLVRAHPYHPTALGEVLLSHFSKVRILEEGCRAELSDEALAPRLAIAVNRDSLETWLMPLIKASDTLKKLQIEIISDDQELTLDYLRKGMVSACLSTSKKSLPGCKQHFLGSMEYVLVCSPDFKAHHFPKGQLDALSLLQAPAVLFDEKDDLHANYLQQFLRVNEPISRYHYLPSVAGFKLCTLNGGAFGMLPKIDIQQELDSGELLELNPGNAWKMPLYWHSFAIESPALRLLNARVMALAAQSLVSE